ncbi:MAG TPA: sulfatase-like hydrolase/transferase [Anaerolineales bacterium]|nr:sulfatase-like hydrolase/transferase [Anaerolineales bacterium]
MKFAGLLPLSLAAPRWASGLSAPSDKQNVIIVVFDALSAFDISALGYQRDTTPNIRRLAKRAIVYHNHYAGSNFTTSGTASLLTGTLPWTHRAIEKNGKVAPAFVSRTIFDVFEDYFRIAYTHNEWAFTLLNQFHRDVDELVARQKLYLKTYDTLLSSLLGNDEDIASVSWVRDMGVGDNHAYSLFLSHLHDALPNKAVARLRPEFPRGLPTSGGDDAFLLEQAVDWVGHALSTVSQPFLGYFHFLPPHAPYNAPLEYADRFKGDGFEPVEKPVDPFAIDGVVKYPNRFRTQYDEFILYMDREFARFYDLLSRNGILDNTWLILTSDHGEMFERGIVGHSAHVLYEPVLRIPLMIFEPGRKTGLDVRSPTSALDLLPTLAHLTGHPIPSWSEGVVLPPFASAEQELDRKLYSIRATRNKPEAPLTEASVALMDGQYKLHYYFGYSSLKLPDTVKLFDIQADPEELKDLFLTKKEVGSVLLDHLKQKLAEVNQPYVR